MEQILNPTNLSKTTSNAIKQESRLQERNQTYNLMNLKQLNDYKHTVSTLSN